MELHEVLKPKDNFYVSQINDQTNSIHKEWYQTNIMNCIRYRKSYDVQWPLTSRNHLLYRRIQGYNGLITLKSSSGYIRSDPMKYECLNPIELSALVVMGVQLLGIYSLFYFINRTSKALQRAMNWSKQELASIELIIQLYL